jgi:DNA-binding CsgD family transcriptional regulator/tetratricopeptide (TPR) repeat protein
MPGLAAPDGHSPSDEDGFVGRQPELARLNLALEVARSNRPRLVVVEGPAGIGKTALVRRFLGTAGDTHVLSAQGDELEARLPLGVVEQLVATVTAEAPEQLTALRRSDPRADPLRIGADLVHLLDLLQQERPVLLVLDDAQWADVPSLQALTYVVRRLQADRVLALFVTRDLHDPRLPEGLRRQLHGDQSVHLRLDGLDAAGLRALAAGMGAGTLPFPVAVRLREHTRGNPLHARAILQELPVEALGSPPGAPLPAPRSFAALVTNGLKSCPPDSQRLVAAAAVLGRSSTLDLVARLAELDDPLPALEPAMAARLLDEDAAPDRMVAFGHPLVHAAVYRALAPTTRAALHARAATLLDSEAAVLRHRVAAASTADAGLAAEVAAFARRQTRSGLWATAGDHLLAAARLTRDASERAQFMLEATECALLSGGVGDHATLTGRIRGLPAGAWRNYLLGVFTAMAGHLGDAERRLKDAWRGSTDPALRGRIAGQLAGICVLQARGMPAARWAGRALSLAPDQTPADLARYLQLVGLGISGRAAEGLALAAALPDPAVASPSDLDALLGRGVLRTWTDDLAGGHRDLAGVMAAARDRSAPFRLLAQSLLGQAELRLGRWDDALVHIERAISIASDAHQRWLASFGHALAVLPLAARGQWEPASAHLHAAQEATDRLGSPAAVAYTAAAAAQLARARDDDAGVIAALRPLHRLRRRDGVGEPGIVAWEDLLVDALVGIGDRGQAEAVLVPFERRAADRDRRSSLAAAARARGSLEAARGNPSAAEAAFRAGLTHARRVQMPFEHALLRLAFGRFLRRVRRRVAAAAELRASRDVLAKLGARPYLRRCEQELAACGFVAEDRARPDAVQLTPQEQAVAHLVGIGLTNRQVARELVVSVKTVEYHLSNVYAKVGVTSRSQLVLQLARD